MAEDNSPIKITEFEGKDVVQIDQSKMVNFVWHKTRYKGKEYSFSRVEDGIVLMRLDE